MNRSTVKKPVIAVDVDEVLLPLHRHFLDHHNAVYGTDFVYPDPLGRYLLQEFTGEDGAVVIEKLQKFYASGETRHLQPLPGAVKAIKRLSKRYDLVIISNQQQFQGEYTKVVLREQFDEIFREVYFTASPIPGHRPELKSELCKRVGARYLIDDALKNALHCAAEGIEVILFGDYYWNRHESLPGGIARCRDWPAVLEYFDGRDG